MILVRTCYSCSRKVKDLLARLRVGFQLTKIDLPITCDLCNYETSYYYYRFRIKDIKRRHPYLFIPVSLEELERAILEYLLRDRGY